MKGNLLEAYAKRLNLAESVYAQKHDGAKLSDQRKLTTAVCLNNVNKFLTEAFANSTGTQLANMGDYKKFCMTLTNLAVPDLIVYDIMAVEPMVSFTGFIAYLSIEVVSNKGQSAQGDLLNNQNLTILDLGECENKLKKEYNLNAVLSFDLLKEILFKFIQL